jgi:hypothetical protein
LRSCGSYRRPGGDHCRAASRRSRGGATSRGR